MTYTPITVLATQAPARSLTLHPWEVRGLLAGRITQIRRPVTWAASNHGLTRKWLHDLSRAWADRGFPDPDGVYRCGYLHVRAAHPEDGWAADPKDDPQERVYCMDEPGDLVWGREIWAPRLNHDDTEDPNPGYVKYRADNDRKSPYDQMDWHRWPHRWKPANTMPQWASRLTLEVLAVRPEPLQSISEDDAIASGSQSPVGDFPWPMQACWTELEAFNQIWDRTYRRTVAHQWAAGGWVWARKVRVVPQTEVSDE